MSKEPVEFAILKIEREIEGAAHGLRLLCLNPEVHGSFLGNRSFRAIPLRQDDKEKRVRRRGTCAFLFTMKKQSGPSSAAESGSRPRRNTAKRKGEVAEAAFLSKATDLGFDVAKPWGDSARFDFIVHAGSRCWRVQVKSAGSCQWRGYGVRPSGNQHVAYTQDDIDFLVAYIVPESIWYVIPVEAIHGLSKAVVFSASQAQLAI